MVADGVYTVAEMKRHLAHFVKSELFAGLNMPPETSRRYFPSSQTLRNIIYSVRTQQIQSKIDQVNLRAKLTAWRERFPDDRIYFREYSSPSPNSAHAIDEDDDSDVHIASEPSKGLLFCYQSKWQQQLLLRYGNEMCLLDATYKTSRYAMPLFFVCVKTNFEYVVVATFITQSEDTASIAEALQVIAEWNSEWQAKHWMVDFSEMEISALQSVFKG